MYAFLDNGRTSDPLFYYTGEVLMDLDQNQARKMSVLKTETEGILVVERVGGEKDKIPVVVYRKAQDAK